MTIGRHDEPTLKALSPSAVAGWLRMRRFEHSGSYGKYGAIFARENNGRTEELVLPTSPQARDFGRRMAELVNDLAEAEDRSSNEVLTDLTLAPFDVVKIRSPDADDYGAIRLTAGLELHEEAHNLILASANATASPLRRRTWRGRRFEEVGAYLNSVRLGQSQRGSFVLTILSPWDFTFEADPNLDLGDTFGRRVIRSLASALKATESAIREGVALGAEPFRNAYTAGVSSNFCKALANLAREGAGIDVSVEWSPLRPENEPVSIQLRREDSAVLTQAANLLVESEIEPDVGLVGLVANIDSPIESFDGIAVIQTQIDGVFRKVRVKFEEAERRRIFDAASDRRWIRVVGDLRRDRQRLLLLNPRDVEQIDVADEEGEAP
jgi:hypothetical protein